MKSHLISSEEPLVEGRDYAALCGKEVPSATWVYHFNIENNREFLGALSAVNTCNRCFRTPLPYSHKYIYGMVAGRDLGFDDETEAA